MCITCPEQSMTQSTIKWQSFPSSLGQVLKGNRRSTEQSTCLKELIYRNLPPFASCKELQANNEPTEKLNTKTPKQLLTLSTQDSMIRIRQGVKLSSWSGHSTNVLSSITAVCLPLIAHCKNEHQKMYLGRKGETHFKISHVVQFGILAHIDRH